MRPASLSHRQQNWFALYARTMAAGCPARPRMTVNAATPCTSELRHAWLYSVRSLFPFERVELGVLAALEHVAVEHASHRAGVDGLLAPSDRAVHAEHALGDGDAEVLEEVLHVVVGGQPRVARAHARPRVEQVVDARFEAVGHRRVARPRQRCVRERLFLPRHCSLCFLLGLRREVLHAHSASAHASIGAASCFSSEP